MLLAGCKSCSQRRDRGDPLNLIRVMPAKGTGMYQSSDAQRGAVARRGRGGKSPVSVIGAGIAGRVAGAVVCAGRPTDVTLHERSGEAMTQSTSYWAGGMLAAPGARPRHRSRSSQGSASRSLDLWRGRIFPHTPFNGSLVVGACRVTAAISNVFAKLTSGHRRLDADGVTELEPSLEGRFSRRGFFICGRRPCRAKAASCRNCMNGLPPPAAP